MNKNTESIGFLIVEARTANGALPVEGAQVYVYPLSEDGKNDAVYSLRTNSSGRTERVALEAKGKALSLSPGNASPFMSYNVSLRAPGFYSSDKSNVPIFEGVTSILPFNLVPLSEYADPESYNPDGIGRFTVTPDTNL